MRGSRDETRGTWSLSCDKKGLPANTPRQLVNRLVELMMTVEHICCCSKTFARNGFLKSKSTRPRRQLTARLRGAERSTAAECRDGPAFARCQRRPALRPGGFAVFQKDGAVGGSVGFGRTLRRVVIQRHRFSGAVGRARQRMR